MCPPSSKALLCPVPTPQSFTTSHKSLHTFPVPPRVPHIAASHPIALFSYTAASYSLTL
ncbi:hypothetical protein BR93DRAFT_925396 [Coniochaeta sp. PMI_546]|nr:hypothetical protein BR93DRAFT_925396 [Coniochaeta sp. PMI_546]